MRKVFKVQDLDCANCAAKMERNAAKIEGVKEVAINFMTQKITLEADDDRFDEIVDEVEKVMKKVDKEVQIIR
jgi:copper chaperone CopZ